MKRIGVVKILFCSVLTINCIFFAGSVYAQKALNLPSLGDVENANLSAASERILGERIMREVRQDKSYVQDKALDEYLNQFGYQLIDSDPEVKGEANFDFHFFAMNDPSINAFALPGGFIGVHTGLLIAAQTESELAGVLAHETGHVTQRHIARMIGQQKQNSLIQLAGFFLGAIAATASVDGGMAAMMGTVGLAKQRQLSFSRDAEREADRIGLQIMDKGGFDTSGMVAFFRRLQTANRAYGDIPAFLSSHPLTSARIADIEDRIRHMRYRQRADHPDFQLMRARVRVLQNESGQGLDTAQHDFTELSHNFNTMQKMSAYYGLALVALKQEKYEQAQYFLQLSAQFQPHGSESFFLTEMAIAIDIGLKQWNSALQRIKSAQRQFSLYRIFDYQYADVLIAQRQDEMVIQYLRHQAQLYRQDPHIQYVLAQVYQQQGKKALMHLALADNYAIKGILPSAIEQLQIARRMPDATFYDLSIIDAKERQFKDQWQLEQKQDKTLL